MTAGEVTFPHHFCSQGSITAAIPWIDVPFEISRVYYLYDLPAAPRAAAMPTASSKRCSLLPPVRSTLR